VKDIFERAGDLLRSVFETDSYKSQDTDYTSAWNELNDYLDEERRQDKVFEENESDKRFNSSLDNALSKDFSNLESTPNSSVDEIKANYKKLIIKYHPDRHANDPKKQQISTEITKRLNESYKRVLEYLGED
jgi:DnaJ-class molecular chaperone